MERGCMKGLESLDLDNTAIKELPSSIGQCTALKFLEVRECKSLIRSLPSSIQYLHSLRGLNLSGCSNLKKFPEMERRCMKRLQCLVLNNTAIKELPSSIGYLTALRELYVEKCKNLRSLPTNICMLKSHIYPSLKDCSNLERFPEIMKDMEQVLFIDLGGTAIKKLPSLAQRMNHVIYLNLSNCKDLVTLPNTIYNLEFLVYPLVKGCPKLKKFPRNLGNLKGLRSLRKLSISHCKLLEEIPELPSTLREIDAHYCTPLETLLYPSTLLSSSLLKLLKAATQDLKHDTFKRSISINFPGSSGIPLWVSNQKMGNQIRIELPMNL